MPSDQPWVDLLGIDPCPEHMVLVQAVRNLIFPDPASTEFVPVAPLVQENIANPECQFLDMCRSCSNLCDVVEIEVSSLDVRDSQIGVEWVVFICLCSRI